MSPVVNHNIIIHTGVTLILSGNPCSQNNNVIMTRRKPTDFTFSHADPSNQKHLFPVYYMDHCQVFFHIFLLFQLFSKGL